MSMLTLDQARTISVGAFARAAELDLDPLTVAVLDAGGHLRLLERADGSGILRPQIAIGKAWGALGLGLPSRELERRSEGRPTFFGALASASDGRVVPAAGAVLVLSDDEIVGAVGVTGDTADNDEQCALAGVEAAGFLADATSDKVRRSAL